MANISQQEVTNRLRTYNGSSLTDRAVFTNKDFSNLDFSNLQLSGAKFEIDSDFTNCKFHNANLRGVFFFGSSQLNGVKFNNSQFYNTNAYSNTYKYVLQSFYECDFISTEFINADMSNSMFVNCQFDACTIKNSNFSNSIFENCQFVNHGIGKITKSLFKNCIFRSANPANVSATSYIPSTEFYECDFEETQFIQLDTAGNGTTDAGLVFMFCNLRSSVFHFRIQILTPPQQPTIDRYRFIDCALGSATIPYVNPNINTHINVAFGLDAGKEDLVDFDRKIIP